MSYDVLAQAQGWLNLTKYNVLPSQLDAGQVQHGVDVILTALSARYDTSTWTDNSNTPGMIIRMISMLAASYTLRKAISEDDGDAFYCDWLEGRVQALIDGLVDGSLDIPDVDPDPVGTGGPVGFYPTDASTKLWEEEGDVEGASARHFTSQMLF